MTRTTVPASKGSATFVDSQVVVDLTVLNTLPGDVVEIIDDTSLAVLGTAVQVGTTTTWRASIELPSNATMVNLSARNKRGLAYSGKLANPFAVSYSGAPTQAPVTDAYFANVSLLLHGGGVDGSTSFIDSSSRSVAVTGFGGAQISTTQSMFGSGSILFDGSGYLTTPASTEYDFGSGDFTIEALVYITGALNDYRPIVCCDNISGVRGWLLLADVDIGGRLSFSCFVGGSPVTVTSKSPAALNTRTHLAVVRSGGSLQLFIDGVPDATAAISGSLQNSGQPLCVGALWRLGAVNISSGKMIGNIDEVRITKGVARYTSGFTPPTNTPAPTDSHRYWRVYITSNNGDPYTTMQQVELRTLAGGMSVCPTSPVTSQSDFYSGTMNTASRLCNRNYTEVELTPWASATGVPVPHWIYIDLGSSMKIIEAAIFCQNFSGGPARAPKDFLIQGSDDPVNWITYTTVSGINNWIAGTGKVFAVQPGLFLTA